MPAQAIDNYHRIVTGCGVVDVSDHALLWATGRDRLDLLHRMSTNDLTQMALHEGRGTVLTTALARMIDRIVVVNLGERALILGSAGTADNIRRWLSGYIFFQDEVTLADASPQWGHLRLLGPRSGEVAERLVPGAAGLKLHHVLSAPHGIVGRGHPVAGASFFVIAEREGLGEWRERAVAAGAVEANRRLYETLRVESGLPQIGHEISEDYLPLEAGLWDDVSFTKGCYIGQEIIARMESRGRLAKRLVGLRATDAGALAVGTTLAGHATGVGEVSGTVTSAVESPRWGWIGLGFVKPAQVDAGTEVKAGGTRARISTLPFAE